MIEIQNCIKVAELIKESRNTVQAWIKLFNEGGLEAITPNSPPGRSSKLIMVLENARAHHSKELEPFLDANKDRLELVFLPPCSPDLNPMEWF